MCFKKFPVLLLVYTYEPTLVLTGNCYVKYTASNTFNWVWTNTNDMLPLFACTLMNKIA